MKIDILCNDGSPIGVVEEDIHGLIPPRIGVGGAESALLTLCAAWKNDGHDVTLYNNPREINRSSFKQDYIDNFFPDQDRDILIVFRSPNHKAIGARGKRIWFSTDQYTVGDFQRFSNEVHKIVTISPHHSKYFKDMYGITNTTFIDLPVRTWEYKDKIEKVKHRCIFTSMPDRGIMPLHAAWPLILREVPDASLVITSDWRLWAEWQTEEATRNFRLAFASLPNVTYMGAIKRAALIQEQMKAEILSYPCQYEELFCITAAEAQVAGAIPVTSNAGALSTTNMGVVIAGNPTDPYWIDLFVAKVVELLKSEDLADRQSRLRELAMDRFSIHKILKQWEEVFNG